MSAKEERKLQMPDTTASGKSERKGARDRRDRRNEQTHLIKVSSKANVQSKDSDKDEKKKTQNMKKVKGAEETVNTMRGPMMGKKSVRTYKDVPIDVVPADVPLRLLHNAVPTEAADTIMRDPLSFVDAEPAEIQVYGKRIKEPRLTAMYQHTGSTSYGYSGKPMKPRAWRAELDAFAAIACRIVNDDKTFVYTSPDTNVARTVVPSDFYVLFNFYRHVRDGVDYHCDKDARPKGSRPARPVVSFSLGDTRTFLVRRIGENLPLCRISAVHQKYRVHARRHAVDP